MDRKHGSSPQIPGILIIIILAGALFSLEGGKADRSASLYDRELRKRAGALDSIKAEIDKRRKKISDLENAEGNYLARLEYLGSNIRASKQYLSMLSCRIDTAETTIVRLTDSLQSAQTHLTDRQAVMRQRLRHAYMTGTSSPLMVLFLAQNPADAINRVQYLEEVYRYDRELIGVIKHAKNSFNHKKNAFESERAQLAALLHEKRHENEMLLKEEASRRSILEDIRSKKKANVAVVAELEQTQRALNEVIKILEQKRKKALEQAAQPVAAGTGPFEQLKGRLPWPLEGKVSALFGRIIHPLYKTVTMNNGIDIAPQHARDVRCIADGTVIYTGSMRGLGRLVIVEHGNNYISIYAQLEQISVEGNESVKAGSVLGKLGEDEEAKLHFEIRRSTDALDPIVWLKR